MSEQEVWLPLPGYGGYYEVSSFGRVKGIRIGSQLGHGLGRLDTEGSNVVKWFYAELRA